MLAAARKCTWGKCKPLSNTSNYTPVSLIRLSAVNQVQSPPPLLAFRWKKLPFNQSINLFAKHRLEFLSVLIFTHAVTVSGPFTRYAP